MLSAKPSIALFIDGPDFQIAARTLGIEIDYKKLLGEFSKDKRLLRASYYTAIIADDPLPASIKPLLDWLQYNGFAVVTKAAKENIATTGSRRARGRMSIELAVDAMELADQLDEMVLFSGDGDFRSLVEAMQRRGIRVTVVSTVASKASMIADELRRQADAFIDLMELRAELGRDRRERPSDRPSGDDVQE